MTVFGITLSAATIWFIAAGILAIIEATTLGLICIWFAAGAAVAAIASMFGAPVFVQVIVFLIASIVFIVLTRPLARKHLNANVEKTNVDAIIGQEGVVEEDISPYQNGQVRADGKAWSATCLEGEIKKGAIVVIKSIKGVTLMVEEKKQEV